MELRASSTVYLISAVFFLFNDLFACDMLLLFDMSIFLYLESRLLDVELLHLFSLLLLKSLFSSQVSLFFLKSFPLKSELQV